MTTTDTTAPVRLVSSSAAEITSSRQPRTVSYWNEKNPPRYTVVETKTRGKGKVVVGEGGVDAGEGGRRGAGVHRIAAVSEVDGTHGELPSDPPARVDGRLAYGYVLVCG